MPPVSNFGMEYYNGIRRKFSGLLSTHGQYENFDAQFEKSEMADYEPMNDDGDVPPPSQKYFDADEALPSPDRPPLRKIDRYIKPEFPCLSQRYTVAVLTCIGFIISFGMRCNMGMAKLQKEKNEGRNCSTGYRFHQEDNCTLEPIHNMFNWTVGTESMVDSSFFWGYLVTQVPGGFLASMLPANSIFGIAIALSSMFNLLIPGASIINSNLLITIRICQGLVEGVTYPACHGIWRHWAPPLERSRLATLALCGSYAGVVIGMPLSGLFIRYISWEAPFYFYGFMGITWYCAWCWLVFEKPSKHPTISARELLYIEKSLGTTTQTAAPTFFTTPWNEFLHSTPVYAIIVANFCRSWNFYLLVLYQASFFQNSFGMDIAETGLVGALPHLFMTVIVPSSGLLADHLRKTGTLTTTSVRKLFNCGGFGMEACFFLIIAHTYSKFVATLALTCGVAFSGFAISGFNVNHLDIAPQYASILMGISNGIGTMAGTLLPIVVDHMTADKKIESWHRVFLLSASIHFCGVIFYAVFASGELQPWAQSKSVEQNPMSEIRRKSSSVKTVRAIHYGSTDTNDSVSWTKQVSEEHVQPELKDVYMTDQRYLEGESATTPPIQQQQPTTDTNPFRQRAGVAVNFLTR